MSVYKRGDTWWVTVSFARRRTRVSAGRGASKEQARELEASLRRDYHAGRVGRAQRHRIEEALERWLKGEAKALAHWRNLASKVASWTPYIGERSVDEAADVAEIAKAGWLEQGLAPATINRRLAALRRVCNLAWKSWRWLDKPVSIELLPGERPRDVQLSAAQVDKLLAACDSQGLRDAVTLAAHTGLRTGEILALRPEQVRDGRILLGTGTKTGRPRSVPLTPEAAKVARHLPIAITRDALRFGFERARKSAGMPWLQLRDLRRTFGSWIVQRTKSLKAAQDLLGHASSTITARHYAHLLDEHLVKAIRSLPRLKVRAVSGSARRIRRRAS